MTGADLALFVGFGAVLAGIWGAYGWPFAAIVGGVSLLWIGAKLQQVAIVRQTAKAQEAER